MHFVKIVSFTSPNKGQLCIEVGISTLKQNKSILLGKFGFRILENGISTLEKWKFSILCNGMVS